MIVNIFNWLSASLNWILGAYCEQKFARERDCNIIHQCLKWIDTVLFQSLLFKANEAEMRCVMSSIQFNVSGRKPLVRFGNNAQGPQSQATPTPEQIQAWKTKVNKKTD